MKGWRGKSSKWMGGFPAQLWLITIDAIGHLKLHFSWPVSPLVAGGSSSTRTWLSLDLWKLRMWWAYRCATWSLQFFLVHEIPVFLMLRSYQITNFYQVNAFGPPPLIINSSKRLPFHKPQSKKQNYIDEHLGHFLGNTQGFGRGKCELGDR